MVTVEVREIAGEAYAGMLVARFWAPYIVRPYDPTGLTSGDSRVAYRVAARNFLKLPSVKG